MKISNKLEKFPPLKFQSEIMKLLSEIPSLKCPKIIRCNKNNSDILDFQGYFVRLIEFVDGTLCINRQISGDLCFLYE